MLSDYLEYSRCAKLTAFIFLFFEFSLSLTEYSQNYVRMYGKNSLNILQSISFSVNNTGLE